MASAASGDRERARDLFKEACDGGYAAGCTALAEWLERNAPAEQATIAALLATACSAQDTRGCALAALWERTAAADGKPGTVSVERAARSCARGDLLGCSVAAHLEARAAQAGDTPGAGQGMQGRAAHEAACAAGEALSCQLLGELCLQQPTGDEQACARSALLRACEGGVAASCLRLADLFDAGEAGPPDPSEAARLWLLGCEGRNLPSCQKLVERARDDDALWPDTPGYTALTVGCELGDATLCDRRAKQLSQLKAVQVTEGGAPNSPAGPRPSDEATPTEAPEAPIKRAATSMEVGLGGRVARLVVAQSVSMFGATVGLQAPLLFSAYPGEADAEGGTLFLLGNVALRATTPVFVSEQVRVAVNFGIGLPTAVRPQGDPYSTGPTTAARRVGRIYHEASALGGFQEHFLWAPNTVAFPTGVHASLDLGLLGLFGGVGVTGGWGFRRAGEPHVFGQADLGAVLRRAGFEIGLRGVFAILSEDEIAGFALQPFVAYAPGDGTSVFVGANIDLSRARSRLGVVTPAFGLSAGVAL